MLNSVKDHKGYTLDSWDVTRDLISSINSKSLKGLFDVYHVQVGQGNIINTIKRDIKYIGYFHIANPPLRSEPWEGELNYSNIIGSLANLNYDGFIGFEFFPTENFNFKHMWDWAKKFV